MACSSVRLPSAGTGRVISANGVADGSSTNTGSADSAGFTSTVVRAIASRVAWRIST